MKPINISYTELAALDYEAIGSYLERTGWRRVDSSNEYAARFTQQFSQEGDLITIILPKNFSLPDAPQRLLEVIYQLSVIEESSPEAILQKLRSLSPQARAANSKGNQVIAINAALILFLIATRFTSLGIPFDVAVITASAVLLAEIALLFKLYFSDRVLFGSTSYRILPIEKSRNHLVSTSR